MKDAKVAKVSITLIGLPNNRIWDGKENIAHSSKIDNQKNQYFRNIFGRPFYIITKNGRNRSF